jgi:hypothetical protein
MKTATMARIECLSNGDFGENRAWFGIPSP